MSRSKYLRFSIGFGFGSAGILAVAGVANELLEPGTSLRSLVFGRSRLCAEGKLMERLVDSWVPPTRLDMISKLKGLLPGTLFELRRNLYPQRDIYIYIYTT
jgi:hypothetical protein